MIAKPLLRLAGRFVLFCLFALSAGSLPSAFASSPSSSAIDRARALLEKEVVRKVPGLSVAVAVNGSLVWTENFGEADLTNKTRVSSKTRFRIGSISKSLTSAGLALMVERGQLEWDTPIQTYLPEYPEKSVPITMRMLAGHLSGIRDYGKGEALSNIAYPDARSRLKVFEADPLIASPGEKFSYSGYNWNVIEAVMERAAHQGFVAFMQANVFEPLQLNDTNAEDSETVDPLRTQFYEVDETGAFVPGPRINSRHAWAAGGYLSTAGDLVRFGSALLHPGLLKESSRQTLFTAQTTNDGKSTGYSVGWYVYPKPKVIFHSGWTVGGLSVLTMLPETNTVVAILTNRGGLNIPESHRLYFDIEKIGYDVARIFADK